MFGWRKKKQPEDDRAELIKEARSMLIGMTRKDMDT